jgi:two-component system, chemotaxis family, sensor kinase CheA
MKLKDAAELQETLAEMLGSADPSIDEIQGIHSLLHEIHQILGSENRSDDAELVQSALDIVKKLATSEIDDQTSALNWLRDLSVAVGKVIRDGVDFAVAGYPEPMASDDPFDQVESPGFDDDFEIDGAIFTEFYQRQGEILETLENSLLDIESGKCAGDRTALMRFFHTIKGEAGMLGLIDISELSHRVEDLLQETAPSTCVAEMINVKDWLDRKFKAGAGHGPEPEPVAEILAVVDGCDRDADPIPEAGLDTLEDVARQAAEQAVTNEPDAAYSGYYEINAMDGDLDLVQEFIAESTEHLDNSEVQLLILEAHPEDKDALNAVFRAFHTIKGVAGFIDMAHVQEFAHKSENLLDSIRKGEIQLSGPVLDIIFEAVDMIKILIRDIADAVAGDGQIVKQPGYPGLLARLIQYASGNIPASDSISADTASPVEGKRPEGAPVAAVSAEDKNEARQGSASPAKAIGNVQLKDAVRVDAERLDLLVETIGELVIAEAMVSQNREIRSSQSVELLRNLDHLDKICRELQQLGMSLRMVPVRPTFQKMARLVRDLSKKSGRPINFTMTGEDTELDKSVVDKIGDPLVHMLRNAVDHGIETDVDQRLAAGKTREGNIELRAFHRGGNICVEVRDDGRGLDRKLILRKAVESGIIKDGASLSDRDVFNLIFEPGFSTASEVTDVSGRGVGMDVVRRNIEELRGVVEISSRKGEGSVISFRLPLTLAIIDGMVVRVGSESYIIPTLSVVRLVRPTGEDYSTVLDKGEMLRFEEELIPMFRLNRMFSIPNAQTELRETVVIVVESEGRRVGLMTDDLVGQQQIVIKSLGESVQGTPGVAGGAIMSNGNVALILDIAGLVKIAHSGAGSTGDFKVTH